MNYTQVVMCKNEQLFEHLRNNGIREDRRFSQFVDLNFYQASNSDLASLNDQQLLEHLEIFGVNEQRRFSQYLSSNLSARIG